MSYLRDDFKPTEHNKVGHTILFRRVQVNKFEDVEKKITAYLDPIITHVVIFSIFRQAYKLRFEKSEIDNKTYAVSLPNLDFCASSAVSTIRSLNDVIRQYSPDAKVVHALPVFPDLYFYNLNTRLRGAPSDIQMWYREKFSDCN